VLGVQFFKGRFFQCELAASGQLAVDSNGAALGKDACVGPGLLWKNPDFGSFDNIGLAMFFLFQLSTMEGWPIMMLRLVDAGSATEGPRRDSLLPAALFGVIFIFITSYFLTNLFIGVGGSRGRGGHSIAAPAHCLRVCGACLQSSTRSSECRTGCSALRFSRASNGSGSKCSAWCSTLTTTHLSCLHRQPARAFAWSPFELYRGAASTM
jgi:hypothetical protein